MAIKDIYTRILKESNSYSNKAREKILTILRDPKYTPEGKKNACASVLADLNDYLAEQMTEVASRADHVCKDVEALAEIEARNRAKDDNYQSLLTNTLTLLPAVVEYGDIESLRSRVKPFEDDPFACAAIEAVLKKTCEGLKDMSRRMSVLSVIPSADGTEKRVNQLRKLQRTMTNHLSAMSISVADPAYSSGSEKTIHQSVRGGGSVISATLDYLDSCSNDCTEYNAEQLHRSGREQPITFDFNHVN